MCSFFDPAFPRRTYEEATALSPNTVNLLGVPGVAGLEDYLARMRMPSRRASAIAARLFKRIVR